MTMNTENEVMCLQAREGQGPLATPEAGRSKGGSPRVSRECRTSSGLLTSRTMRDKFPGRLFVFNQGKTYKHKNYHSNHKYIHILLFKKFLLFGAIKFVVLS